MLYFVLASGFTILFIYLWHKPGIMSKGIFFPDKTIGDLYLLSLLGLWVRFGLIFFTHFIIRIKENSVQYKYSAFPSGMKWKIPFESIDHYAIRKYNAWKEFRRYGMRSYRHKVGRAFTMKGNWGLELFLTDGEKILLGTQKPDLLRIVMNKLLDKPEKD